MKIFNNTKDVRERLRQNLPDIMEFMTETDIVEYEVSNGDTWGRQKEKFVFKKDNCTVTLHVEMERDRRS